MSDFWFSESKLMRAEKLLIELGSLVGTRLRLHPDVAGDRWVSECVDEFAKKHGRDQVRDVSRRQLPYDLVVAGFKVQCKARTPKLGRSMTIEKGLWGHLLTANAFDFLALKYGDARYVIPRSALIQRDGKFRNDIKPDRFWKYKDCWSLIGQSPDSYPLFSEESEGNDGR